MTRLLAIILGTALLAACANTPPAAQAPSPAPAIDTDEDTAAIEPLERPFPDDSIYPLLVAEFAIRRRAYDTALEQYLQQAYLLDDAGVARHTTRLAQFMRNDAQTLQAASLWLELEPDSIEANVTVANLLTSQGRSLEALPLLTEVARAGAQANFPMLLKGFGQLDPGQRSELVSGIQTLSKEFPEDPALLLTQALLYADFKNYPLALSKLDALFAIKPEQQQALLLEARVLLAKGDKAPYRHLQKVLKANPENTRLRLEYARLLTNTDMQAARAQFEILSAQAPQDADLLLSLALINREIGDDIVAKAYLQQILTLDDRNNEAHYYLGRIAEGEGQGKEAASHYMQVGDSSEYLSATQRLSRILVNANRIETNRDWFERQRAINPRRKEQLYSIEADVLGGAGAFGASMAVLNTALAEFPDSTSLRYSRSMLGEQQNDLALMERDLRAIIRLDPSNATALNALGYTLANRTERYSEAFDLISRALELEPEAPAILDSMGWVLYRLGDYSEAIEYLLRAYAAFPDAEVAAHLGEVLWVNGDTERATSVWQGALLKDPDHPVLSATLERLGVELPSGLPVLPPANGQVLP